MSVSRCCGDDVYARVEVCFTCEEYERLVCELARIKCGHHECCDEERVRLFDQDDCDDDKPVRKTNTTKGR